PLAHTTWARHPWGEHLEDAVAEPGGRPDNDDDGQRHRRVQVRVVDAPRPTRTYIEVLGRPARHAQVEDEHAAGARRQQGGPYGVANVGVVGVTRAEGGLRRALVARTAGADR